MSRSRKRPPTAAELELWGKVTETVVPFDDRPAPVTDAAPQSGDIAKEKPARKTASATAVPPARPEKPQKPPPALSLMDRRTRSRLTRGVVSIDKRVDLHGLTQAAAEGRLRRFLHDAQEGGAKVVLVITGKGTPEGGERNGGERGVLRRMVPHWLSATDMREVVVGFEEASRAHGGAGALYVRVRRRR